MSSARSQRESRAGVSRSQRATHPSIAVVLKRSAWRIYLEDRKDPRIAKLIAAKDPLIDRLKAAHEEHEATVHAVKAALAGMSARVTLIPRRQRYFDSSDFDLVVTVGGDGTLLAASHGVVNTPILGVNSSPSSSVGFFCGARRETAEASLQQALAGKLHALSLTRMKVTLNGRVVAARVMNDALFCHTSPAATSRYIATLKRIVEEHKSSGFWIGPAAGSTAAQRSAGGSVLPLSSEKLQLVVREPYTPHGEQYRLRRALIGSGELLRVRSKMHEAKLFFDGPDDWVGVGYGDMVDFTKADQPLTVLGIRAKRSA